MSLTTAEQTTSVVPAAFTGDWALGWRYETVRTVNGQPEMVRIPLTPEEALHPQEGYVMPIRTDHDRISDDLCDMLRPYLEAQADVAVFHAAEAEARLAELEARFRAQQEQNNKV